MTSAALEALADYAAAQGSTGLVVAHGGATLLERCWTLTPGREAFAAAFSHGTTADGAPREDVASQQKSLIGLLATQAEDRGLLDTARPASDILGRGWTLAPAKGAVTVRHLLEMNSGLTEALDVEAAPGERFFYNTPAYARLQSVLEAVTGQPLATLVREWVADPLSMADTEWARRPADLAGSSGNAWGLVTTAGDLAKLGAMLLGGGLAPDGRRMVSESGLKAMLTPTSTNPAYGRLWWLNGGAWAVDAVGARKEGPLVPDGPADLVLALGAHGRVLGVVPSKSLVVARIGPQPTDPEFRNRLWALV
ncbi:MAG: serine hydrolase domain-containing protein, partial [Caulobacteraceae bacterium]